MTRGEIGAGDLAGEARRSRAAGLVAVLAVALSFAALMVLVGSQPAGAPRDASVRSLEQADRDAGTLWLAVALRSLALVGVAVVGVHLARLIAARGTAPRALSVLAIVGPAALVVAAVASQLALLDAAHAFVAGGPRTDARARDLITEGAVQRASAVATVAAGLTFSVWLGWTALAAARVGLLTRFLGHFGVGAGLASVLVPVAGQGLVMGWLASVAILLLGWWPGGRGPAWTTGTALPWDVHAGRR